MTTRAVNNKDRVDIGDTYFNALSFRGKDNGRAIQKDETIAQVLVVARYPLDRVDIKGGMKSARKIKYANRAPNPYDTIIKSRASAALAPITCPNKLA